jgi:hypothetical protein
MSKFQLFQYAVIKHQKTTADGKTEYTGAEIVLAPDTMLARNEREALFKITRLIPDAQAANPDDIDIIIRGF